ncbi:hypothetical protein [Roseococcus thiosulfatophilus]|uniref:hypothetical protein n=1 Tax=Roseococcus thiosulfatophilus TaxID=35813 RepID=UPI001F5D8C8B|nr:hypothetical protein [Roseococcus thiosulfatophilus]
MVEYAWPEALRPSRLTFYLQHNTTRFVSPVTRATQVLRREGARWVAQATFDPLDRVRAGLLEGLLAALAGSVNTVRVWDWRREFRTPVPQEVVDIALAERSFRLRPARLWGALLDVEGAFVADPFPLWAGLMDTMEVTDGAEPRVALTCESRLVDLERAEVRRYTDADQQAEYLAGYELEFRPASVATWQGYGGALGATAASIPTAEPTGFRARAVARSGAVSGWREAAIPGAVTAPAALGITGGVRLSGGFPADAARLQLFEASSASLAAAVKLAAEPTALPWDRTGLTAGQTRWYWLRAVSAEGNVSALAGPVTATAL